MLAIVCCVVSACSAQGQAVQPTRAPQPMRPVQPKPTTAAVSVAAKLPPLTITVVATNDVHGHVTQLPLLGGYLQVLRALRKQDGGAVLLLDAGDIMQGTLESNLVEGAVTIRAFNALGYAAAAVGNHEFDYGPSGAQAVPLTPSDDPLGALRARAQEAQFALLSANARNRDGTAFPVTQVKPSLMLEVQGVRVGIVGGMTKDALTQTQPPNVAELMLDDLTTSVAAEARSLRSRGASIVIALVHAGGECHDTARPDDLSSCDDAAEIFGLARKLSATDVDLIIGGHTHAAVAHHVNGIPVIESMSNGRAFGRVDLRVDRSTGRVLSHTIAPPHALCPDALDAKMCATETYEGAPVERDAAVSAAIAPDLANAAAMRTRLLGVTVRGAFKKLSKVESPLGNLVADLMRGALPGADAAINNGGSLRASLPKGPLTYGDFFEMTPFDNSTATLRISARELGDLIARNLQTDRGFLALSGLRAKAHCVDGVLKVDLKRPSGRRLPDTTLLTVVTSDYLATGGDALVRDLAPDAIDIHRDRLLRDGMLDALSRRSVRSLDPRDKSIFDPARPRIAYAGERPISCP
jgi:5'-nucleotidase